MRKPLSHGKSSKVSLALKHQIIRKKALEYLKNLSRLHPISNGASFYCKLACWLASSVIHHEEHLLGQR